MTQLKYSSGINVCNSSEFRSEAMDRFRIDGKIAIISGATRGIGRAAALGLAEAGADVVVLGNTRSPEETADTIRGLGRQALALQGDLCDRAFRDRVLDEVMTKWGHVDILVNMLAPRSVHLPLISAKKTGIAFLG